MERIDVLIAARDRANVVREHIRRFVDMDVDDLAPGEEGILLVEADAGLGLLAEMLQDEINRACLAEEEIEKAQEIRRAGHPVVEAAPKAAVRWE